MFVKDSHYLFIEGPWFIFIFYERENTEIHLCCLKWSSVCICIQSLCVFLYVHHWMYNPHLRSPLCSNKQEKEKFEMCSIDEKCEKKNRCFFHASTFCIHSTKCHEGYTHNTWPLKIHVMFKERGTVSVSTQDLSESSHGALDSIAMVNHIF